MERQIYIGKTYIYSWVFFYISTKTIQCRKESPFNKQYLYNGISICKEKISDSHFTSKNINSSQVIDLQVKPNLIKQQENNFVTSGKDSLDIPKTQGKVDKSHFIQIKNICSAKTPLKE